MLDTDEALDMCSVEIGAPCEQLLTPLTRRLRQYECRYFAVDNGAFAGFEPTRFRGLLDRNREAKHLCRFVVVPDVVADARRTIEVFDHWKYELAGWPLAFAVQDGIERLPIPWRQIQAIFVGGSTAFKMSTGARAVICAAQAMEKWVHVGRVNSPGRWEYFEELGVDSIDGTGLSRFSDMRRAIYNAKLQMSLEIEGSKECVPSSTPE